MSAYSFVFSETNSYGHAVALLRGLAQGPGVHIDIGCGFGAISEPLRDHGLEYVGFDRDEESVRELRARGFEAHTIDLEDAERAIRTIREALGTRKLASLSMLDVLAHVTNGPALLPEIRGLVEGAAVPFVVCVPNVGHRDLAAKLLGGRWDYTPTGLLDHTHVIHHTERLLTSMLARSGFRQVDAADVVAVESDQHFPSDFPLFAESTTVGALFARVKEGADPTFNVQQFVRAFLPAAPSDAPILVERTEPDRPFLTVVTRTQGRRIEPLREVFLALAAQTDRDFEHLVIAHKVTVEQQIAIERLIEQLPKVQRARTRLVRLDRGGRAAPLNLGFELARGTYVVALDDDDMVFSHWVETFRTLARDAGFGRVLRTVAVDQDIVATPPDSVSTYRTTGGYVKAYPSEYDLLAHLERNFTPLMCLAFPRALHRDLGLRFDDSLSICEDWDFEMRAVLLVGVAASPEITAIYRRWRTGESSASLYADAIWKAEQRRIAERLDSTVHVLPAGTIARYREIIGWTRHLEQRVKELEERRWSSMEEKVFRARKTGARWRRRVVTFGRALRSRIKDTIDR